MLTYSSKVQRSTDEYSGAKGAQNELFVLERGRTNDLDAST